MAKLKLNEKRIQLSFQRPDDVALYAFLEKRAYERRYDLPTFILLSLHEAFEGQVDFVDEIGISVSERLTVVYPQFDSSIRMEPKPISTEPIEVETMPTPVPSTSTDDGYESTKASIVANNALYLKKAKPRKGTIPGAPDTVPASLPASPK